MNGIVVIDKPKGATSHDVVGMLRKRFLTRRVGHTGTLDPIATGVLPVCIGNATRAADMLTESDKRYRAVFMLGRRTDTLDILGELQSTSRVTATDDAVRDCVLGFIGEQEQLPPMYSAIKQNGRKLYELAREGKEVEREKRRINIYSIDVVDINLPYVTIDVFCSKGTYIRSLCDDIGQRLGCGAVMTELRRTAAAGFTIEDAYTIEALDALPDKAEALIPTDRLFMDYPAIRLNEKQEKSIVNGVRMTWRFGADGRFLCISQIEDMRLKLVRSFWT